MKSTFDTEVAFNAEKFRKRLHQHPELSCHEVKTANLIAEQLRTFGLNPITQIGGNGLFAVIEGESTGDTTLLRADFDAVPVAEHANHDHISTKPGVMHACGHDGHATSLLSVARILSEAPPKGGKVILLFQPAEEVGVGAAAMLKHPELKKYHIDNTFAYHNLPGHPLHNIVVKEGTFACASTGVCIELKGKTSHAAYPENGINPVNAVVEILQYLQDLPTQYPDTFSLVTIVNTQLGEKAFGVSAGFATIMATLRSECNSTFDDMQNKIQNKLAQIEQNNGLGVSYSWHEPFNAAVNSTTHVNMIREQATGLGLAITELREPMRWSEDFSQFLQHSSGALFGIGSGLSSPELHNPDYDFPDEILETASSMFVSIVKQIHG